MRNFAIGLLLLTLSVAPVAGQEGDAAYIAPVQQFLADRDCDPGPVDGQWGGKSGRALALYSQLTGIKAARPFTGATVRLLSAQDVHCTEAANILPARPKVFADPDLMSGQEWFNYLETGQRVGRVVVETDPAHIRSGSKSLRLHLVPDDCGGPLPGFGEWHDCTSPASPNERVAVRTNPSAEYGKDYWYGISIFLDEAQFRRQPPQDPQHRDWWMDVNLYQWINNEPMFNVLWNSNEPDLLSLRVNDAPGCNPCEMHEIASGVLNRWVDIVVHSKFSRKDDGYFIMWVDGQKVFERQGPTVPDFVQGPNSVAETIMIYRYSGVNSGWPELTAWFDQIIRSTNVEDLAASYAISDDMRATD